MFKITLFGKQKLVSWRQITAVLAALVLVPLTAAFVSLFVFQSYEVNGMSMQSALQNHDRLIVWKVPRTVAGLIHQTYIPDRYSIVVFTSHVLHEDLIKRVIGLPGERVVIADGRVTVYNQTYPDGFRVDADQPYANNLPLTPGNMDVVVPQNDIFVLGDNRDNSTDSSEFGPVPASDIVGTLLLRVFPLVSN